MEPGSPGSLTGTEQEVTIGQHTSTECILFSKITRQNWRVRVYYSHNKTKVAFYDKQIKRRRISKTNWRKNKTISC